MIILGISAFYHDSAAAILDNGRIIAAAQEERFSRKKHDPGFPGQAIAYCLDEAGLNVADLDAVVFYDKPLLKFERLLETYYGFSPKGLRSFIAAIPVWLNEKLFLKRLIRQELEKLGEYDRKKLKLLFPEHHLSHAASAFYPSPFDEAAILTIDGVGEWATATICKGTGKNISLLKELHFPHSLGLLYSAFTYFLGFRVNSGEYKLMGLAPYGNPDAEQVNKYVQLIKKNLVEIFPDGSIWLNQAYFNYSTGLRMLKDKKWEELFGLPKRVEESELEQSHCDLALAIQRVTEEVVMKMAEEAKQLTGSKNLCLAGGVALNCVANGKLVRSGLFEKVWVQPAAGDAGGALGAALAAWHIHFSAERETVSAKDSMQNALLGPEFSEMDCRKAAKRNKAHFQEYKDFRELCQKIAGILANGKVVGWFQGRMEFGPRALGARSILGDPRNGEMQKKLNLKIKYRESFRPFAPIILAEAGKEYFEDFKESPYMMLVFPVSEKQRMPLPDGYHNMALREKLYCQRSTVPAVTHIDFSARVQSVDQQNHPGVWELLTAFKSKTGCPVLVNTSFNVRGEPIVCTPEDAYHCFMQTEMDYLVLGNLVFDKEEQSGPVAAAPSLGKSIQPMTGSAQLVILTGFLVLAYIFKSDVLVWIATVAGLVFVFIPFIGKKVVWFWYKLAEVLGWINSRILLTLIFFLILFPLAMASRLFSKDPLDLKKSDRTSMFKVRKHQFEPKDLQNPW